MENGEMTDKQRFINIMQYKSVDRVPNYEVGVWGQTRERWLKEGLNDQAVNWDWWTGDDYFGLDIKEFIDVNYDMMPRFEHKIIEKTDRYEIFQDELGRVRKALLEGTVGGTRLSMDQYMRFPVANVDDFRKLKKRYQQTTFRYPADWEESLLLNWRQREVPLILGRNCSTLGFYWRARDWMGTENVSFGWYDQPALMHEMMEFVADFTIEVSRPILNKIDVEYVMINEDMSMKTGPLISPDFYKMFIYKHMQRLVDFLKSNGVKYVMVDTDGNCEKLIPLFMELGIDAIWPLERAAGMEPVRLRETYGKDLRLYGGVDKRELSRDKSAIDNHLAHLVPLVEQGGFIPTVDHTVSPDISLENFKYYLTRKQDLLSGRF